MGIDKLSVYFEPNLLCEMTKVADMFRCGKENFLEFYACECITETEWENTYKLVMLFLQQSGCFSEDMIEEFIQVERENR